MTSPPPVFPIILEPPILPMIAPLLKDSVLLCVAILLSEGCVLVEAIRAPEGYENEHGFFFGVELRVTV